MSPLMCEFKYSFHVPSTLSSHIAWIHFSLSDLTFESISCSLRPPHSIVFIRLSYFTFGGFPFHIKILIISFTFLYMSCGGLRTVLTYSNCGITNVLTITIFPFIVRFLKFQHFMIASHFVSALVKFSSTI